MSSSDTLFANWLASCQAYAPSVHVPDLSAPHRVLSVNGQPESKEIHVAFLERRRALCTLTRETLAQLLGMTPSAATFAFSHDAVELESSHERARNIFTVLATKPKFSCLLLYGWEQLGTPQAESAKAYFPGLELAEWMGSQIIPFLLNRTLDASRTDSERETCIKTLASFINMSNELQKVAEKAVAVDIFPSVQAPSTSSPVPESQLQLQQGTTAKIPPLLLRFASRVLVPITKLYTAGTTGAMAIGAPSDSLRHWVEVILRDLSSPHAFPSQTLLALAATANDQRAFELFFCLGGLFDSAAVDVIAGRVTRADAARGRSSESAGRQTTQSTYQSSRYATDADLLSATSSGGAFLGEEDRDMFVHILNALQVYSVGAPPAPIARDSLDPQTNQFYSGLTEPGGGVRSFTRAEAENLLRLLSSGYAHQHTKDMSCYMQRVSDAIPVEDLNRAWWRHRYLATLNSLTALFSSLRHVSSMILSKFILVPSTFARPAPVSISTVEALMFVRSVADSLTSAQWYSIVLPAVSHAATLLVQEVRAQSHATKPQSSSSTYYTQSNFHQAHPAAVQGTQALTSQLSVSSERVGTRAIASSEFVSELLSLLQHCWTLYYEEERAEQDARNLAQVPLPMREDLGYMIVAQEHTQYYPATVDDPVRVRAAVGEQLFKTIVRLLTAPVVVPAAQPQQLQQSHAALQPTNQYGAAFSVLLHDHPEVIQLPGQAATILLSHLADNSVSWLQDSLVVPGMETSAIGQAHASNMAGARIVQEILLRCLGLKSAHTSEVGIADFNIPSQLLTRESEASLLLMLVSTPSLPALRLLTTLCKDHHEFVDEYFTLFEYAFMSSAKLLSLPYPAHFIQPIMDSHGSSTPELAAIERSLESISGVSGAATDSGNQNHTHPLSPITILQKYSSNLSYTDALIAYETMFEFIKAFQPWAKRIIKLQQQTDTQFDAARRPRQRYAAPGETNLPTSVQSLLPGLTARGSSLCLSWMLQCFVTNWAPMSLSAQLDAALALAIRSAPEFTPKQLATLLFALPPSVWSPRKVADPRIVADAAELATAEAAAVQRGQLPAKLGHTLNPAVAHDERSFLRDTIQREKEALAGVAPTSRFSDPYSVPSAVIQAAATAGTPFDQINNPGCSVSNRAAAMLAEGTASATSKPHAAGVADARAAAVSWRSQEHLRYALGPRPQLGKLSRIALAQILPHELLGDEDVDVVGTAIDALAQNPKRFLTAHFASVYETSLISAGIHPCVPSSKSPAALQTSSNPMSRDRAATSMSPFLEHYLMRQTWGELEKSKTDHANVFLLPIADRLLYALKLNRQLRSGAASERLHSSLVELTIRAAPALVELAIHVPPSLSTGVEPIPYPSGYMIAVLQILARAAQMSRENDPEQKASPALVIALDEIARRLEVAASQSQAVRRFTHHLVRCGYFEARLAKPKATACVAEQKNSAVATYAAMMNAQQYGLDVQAQGAESSLHELAQQGVGGLQLGVACLAPISTSFVGSPQASCRGEVSKFSTSNTEDIMIAAGIPTCLTPEELNVIASASHGWLELTQRYRQESRSSTQQANEEKSALLARSTNGELWFPSYSYVPAEHIQPITTELWKDLPPVYDTPICPPDVAHSINYGGEMAEYYPLAPVPVTSSHGTANEYTYAPQVDAITDLPPLNSYSPLPTAPAPPAINQDSSPATQTASTPAYTADLIAALPVVPAISAPTPTVRYANPVADRPEPSNSQPTKVAPPPYSLVTP